MVPVKCLCKILHVPVLVRTFDCTFKSFHTMPDAPSFSVLISTLIRSQLGSKPKSLLLPSDFAFFFRVEEMYGTWKWYLSSNQCKERVHCSFYVRQPPPCHPTHIRNTHTNIHIYLRKSSCLRTYSHTHTHTHTHTHIHTYTHGRSQGNSPVHFNIHQFRPGRRKYSLWV